jgi:hypothetical protein
MNDIFSPPQVAARRPGHSQLHNNGGLMKEPREKDAELQGCFSP